MKGQTDNFAIYHSDRIMWNIAGPAYFFKNLQLLCVDLFVQHLFCTSYSRLYPTDCTEFLTNVCGK